MAHGRWTENPEPMMFYDDGSLADGQHRLFAIVLSDTTQQMYVIRGVDKANALNINTGSTRSLQDNLRIATGEKVSKTSIGMVKVLAYGSQATGFTRRMTNAERQELLGRFRPHVEWVNAHRPTKLRVSNAIVAAAIARAHMHEKDLDRLGEFCTVLGTGMPQGSQDSACIAIRNYLFEHSSYRQESRDMFLKCMNAIRYFMRRKPLTVIKTVKEEAYPLPEKFEKNVPKRTLKITRALTKRAEAQEAARS
jgi:hypothetical protein